MLDDQKMNTVFYVPRSAVCGSGSSVPSTISKGLDKCSDLQVYVTYQDYSVEQ